MSFKPTNLFNLVASAMAARASRRLALAMSIAFLGPASASPAVTSLWSDVQAYSKIDTAETTDLDDQSVTINPLMADVITGGGGLSFDIDASATWSNPAAGLVELDYFRGDSTQFGYGDLFSGHGRFRYSFSVDEQTAVSVDYDATGSATYSGQFGDQRWWAMQGFTISVAGQNEYLNFSLDFSHPVNAPSPQGYNGTANFTVPSGSHTLEIIVYGGALGNFQGDRTMTGDFVFQIGEPITEPLPGDANGDGSVDVTDLGILASYYGQSGGHGWDHADFTGDGFVDVSDLGILASHYGESDPTAGIPEPGTTALLLCGLALLCMVARRRK